MKSRVKKVIRNVRTREDETLIACNTRFDGNPRMMLRVAVCVPTVKGSGAIHYKTPAADMLAQRKV